MEHVELNERVGDVKVIIDGTLELDLPAPPRQGEIIAWSDEARRVESVVWIIPNSGRSGAVTTGEDVVVHVQLERPWREATAVADLHARFVHPDFEYRTTEGVRKRFDATVPPVDANGDPDPTWEVNADAGRGGRERFAHTEMAYWRRRRTT
ncbi:hypothetical protein ABT071_21475 [Streptomyces sp. NPDC002506]|uniref:hypothetical protein n=1 Tax=Streptomyces sp. NPDC002506 TaxID=3154536 RepID=UPI00331E8BD9